MLGIWEYIFKALDLEKELAKVPIFEGLSKGELNLIIKYCYERKHPDGEIVFYEGDPSSSLYIIMKGAVDIFKGKKKVTTINKGEFFGELSLVDPSPRSATTVAKGNTVLVSFSKTQLEHISNIAPKTANKILRNISKVIARRLKYTNELLDK
ncbi:MAG: cyclic nucleotide-binding domain-containing protein [Candidatus Woesearchaeota archaeon]